MKKIIYIILGIVLLSALFVYVKRGGEKKLYDYARKSFAHLDAGDRALSMDEYDKAVSEYKLALQYPHCRDAAIRGIETALAIKTQRGYSEHNKHLFSEDDWVIARITDDIATGKEGEAYQRLQNIENEVLRAHIRKIFFSEETEEQSEETIAPKPIITTETNITRLADHVDLRPLTSSELGEDSEVKVITHTYKSGTDTNHFGAIKHALSIGETNVAREIFSTYSELALKGIPQDEVDQMRAILGIK